MTGRRRKKATKLARLVSNRKIQVLFLFALLGIGLLASLGVFPSQNVYGYKDRVHDTATVYIMGRNDREQLYELSSLLGVEFPSDDLGAIQSGFVVEFEGQDPPPGHPYTGFMECWTSNEREDYVTLVSRTLNLSLSVMTYQRDGVVYNRYIALTDHTFNPTNSDFVRQYWVGLYVIADEQGTNLFKFKMTVTDGDGVTEIYEVFTSISGIPPLSPPLIIDAPLDCSYVVGTTGNVLEWTLFEYNPATYMVTIDGVAGNEIEWTNSSFVSIDVDGLSLGSHTIEIVFTDVVDNSVTDSVGVEVTSIEEDDDDEFDLGEYEMYFIIGVVIVAVLVIFMKKSGG